MKACAFEHTITLSDDGIVYSFGRNDHGELGLGHKQDVSLPTPIPNLPKIDMISCGYNFTVVWIMKVLCGHLVKIQKTEMTKSIRWFGHNQNVSIQQMVTNFKSSKINVVVNISQFLAIVRFYVVFWSNNTHPTV